VIRQRRDLKDIDYYPMRFLIHLGLIFLSIITILPIALWFSGDNYWVFLAIWLPSWFATTPIRLFAISLILALWVPQ